MPGDTLAQSTAPTYQMKSTPWIIPVTRTHSGISAMYFSGMAMKSNTRNDIPSVMLDNRRWVLEDVNDKAMIDTGVMVLL